jgi:hypothetical protein
MHSKIFYGLIKLINSSIAEFRERHYNNDKSVQIRMKASVQLVLGREQRPRR